MESIKKALTLEIVVGYAFVAFSIMHYMNEEIVATYGTMIIAWILFTTDAVLKRIDKCKN